MHLGRIESWDNATLKTQYDFAKKKLQKRNLMEFLRDTNRRYWSETTLKKP